MPVSCPDSSPALRAGAAGVLTALLAACLLAVPPGPAAAEHTATVTNGRIAYTADYRLYTVQPDGTDRRRQPTPAGVRYASGARTSPDGTRVVYRVGSASAPDEIHVMDRDGTNDVLIDVDEATTGVIPQSWSPDGTQVAYLAEGGIWIADADGGGSPRQITTEPGTTSSPDWSPDGSELLYGSRDPVTNFLDIFATSIDGAHTRKLTDDKWFDFLPRWAPDGQSIVYYSDRRDPLTEPYAYTRLWTAQADGSQPTRITQATDDMFPVWSPDGRWIAYLGGVNDTRGLWLVRPDGTDAHLSLAGATIVPSDWAPLPPGAPAVVSVAPSALGAGAQNQELTVTGLGFTPATAVSGGGGIRVLSTSYVDATELRVRVTVAATAPPGSKTLTVVNPDGQRASGTVSVTAAPLLTGATPNAPVGMVTEVRVAGSGFQPGLTVTVAARGVRATVLAVTPTEITLRVTVTSTATPGTYRLTVINPDAGRGQCTCLTVS